MTAPQLADQPDKENFPLEEVVQRTQSAVVEGVEAVIQRQMVPFLEHSRKTILATVEEAVQKHGDSLTARLKGLALDTAEELLKQQIEPLLERARRMLVQGLDNAALVQKYTDHLAGVFKQLTREAVVEVFQVQLPSYSARVGRRVVDYVVAGTLLCLAAVLLVLGLVLGLAELGVPAYATYLLGGVLAGGMAFVLIKWRGTFGPSAGSKEGGPGSS